jgi:hypothetical protein
MFHDFDHVSNHVGQSDWQFVLLQTLSPSSVLRVSTCPMASDEDVDLDKALEVAVRAAKGAGELIAKTFRM